MADKIRLDLIGASVKGTWSARSHLPALQASTDVELTAVCTTKADSAEAARRAWGARLAFDDYRKMIASPEIDAVAVGLQARVNPALMHMKELVTAGSVGEVMAVHVSLMREGVLTRPSHRTWQRDARPRRQYADHCQWPHGGRDALRRRRLQPTIGHSGDPGHAVARHRHQHIARRHLAGQRAQRKTGEWCRREYHQERQDFGAVVK
jgi:predicted dehydrogenase